MLVGIRNDSFYNIKYENRLHFVRLFLLNKNDGFKWNLVIVYGAAQKKEKIIFLTELAHMSRMSIYPVMIVGDSDIIRKENKKNRGGYNRWSFIFNAIIKENGLRELTLSGRHYTWSNDHEDPTYERRRKNAIMSLCQEEGIIEGDKNLIKYITNFYNNYLVTLNIQI